MSEAVFAPGEKTHRDENFPVASLLIGKRYRAPVLAFYRFARAADDVADHPDLPPEEKILRLDAFEATLRGHDDTVADALPLREALATHQVTARHALDLLIAFRQDAVKQRYEDWDDLMRYCACSANPVGRFVLDVHGEDKALWPASDALCSALQIINHLQDCQADYRRLNRVYIPQDALARHGIEDTALGAERASPPLRACLSGLAARTQELMQSAHFSGRVHNKRLAVEVATIEMLAGKLLALLRTRDPLSERVHLGKITLITVMAKAIVNIMVRPRRIRG